MKLPYTALQGNGVGHAEETQDTFVHFHKGFANTIQKN